MELKGKKIVFLGDSITQGCCTSHDDAKFSTLIQNETGCISFNHGISGTRFAFQPGDDPQTSNDFCTRFARLEADADIVVVFGGVNDYFHGLADVGCFEDRTYNTFYGACHTLMIKLLEKYPGKPILFITPLHTLGEENIYGHWKDGRVYADLKTYVNIIREVAEYYSLPILDLYAESGMQPTVDIIKETYMPDGCHPSDQGHVLLARKIIAKLKTM